MSAPTRDLVRQGAVQRRLPLGAECHDSGTHFRVWAPKAKRVTVCVETKSATTDFELDAEPHGYFSGFAPLPAGTLYRYRLDEASDRCSDPVSRFQPQVPHGPSQVVDAREFTWTDANWKGLSPRGQVVYEMHVGAFTREGTWTAAIEQLSALADLGITTIELMPVADYPGQFGWGYDGVNLFAPSRLYGSPDEMRRFVDRAHAVGLGVILDVVYNHVGPDGNFLPRFSDDYFSRKHVTDWGACLNFDEQNSQHVREYVLTNVRYWIQELHVDGLRLDATQDVKDESPDHILAAIVREARAAADGRSIYIIGENEPQETNLVRDPQVGGCGLDALWNDDFHHSAMVLLSGRNEAYYSDHLGRPEEFIAAVKYGYLYQGQWYSWQKKRRGTPGLDLEPKQFVNYIQNHDQIANTLQGRRAHDWTSPGRYKAMTALLLLAPQTPTLFMGQEFASSSPFFYFADHKPELAALVAQGRREFMAQFPSISRPEVQASLPDPGDPQTFARSKLDFSERDEHAAIYALHRDLLALRRDDPAFAAQRKRMVDGAVLGEKAFLLRYFGLEDDDRLLIVNFDHDLRLTPRPEPLLAPPGNMAWQVQWSSEDTRYGGAGPRPFVELGDWIAQGESATVYRPVARPASETSEQGETS